MSQGWRNLIQSTLYVSNIYRCFHSSTLSDSLSATHFSATHFSATHFSAMTGSIFTQSLYPPGVLTGPFTDIRFDVMSEDGSSMGYEFHCVDEQWFGLGQQSCPCFQSDFDEMFDLIDGQLDEESVPLLQAVADGLARDLDLDNEWLNLVDSECVSAEVAESLSEFEEDYDYEESLKDESIKNDEINFHRLLATPPEYRACGVDSHRDRFRFTGVITNPFPLGRTGYALAWTTYGKIYIPEKFRNFTPQVGALIDTTVALQDVCPKHNGGGPNKFRFTSIYIH